MLSFNKKENGPDIRVVGLSHFPKEEREEKKEQIKEKIRGSFGEKHLDTLPESSQEELKKLEYTKSKEELFLIDLANKKTNEWMQKAKITPYDVPEENLHIVPPDIYKKINPDNKTNAAITIQNLKAVFFNAEYCRKNNFYFSSAVFHELFHLKSCAVYEAWEKEIDTTTGQKETKLQEQMFRSGLQVLSTHKTDQKDLPHSHFKGLNEAVTSWAENEYCQELLQQPLFEKEKEWLRSKEAEEIRKKIASKENYSNINDIVWVSNNGKDWWAKSYRQHQKVLEFIGQEIQKEFPNEYKSPEEAIEEFVKSNFNGHLRIIAKLVEKTFGKRSFRALASMDINASSANQTLEDLRKKRRDILKSNQPTTVVV